jgi:hypothetical protein
VQGITTTNGKIFGMLQCEINVLNIDISTNSAHSKITMPWSEFEYTRISTLNILISSFVHITVPGFLLVETFMLLLIIW